jgi:hypothetical protein
MNHHLRSELRALIAALFLTAPAAARAASEAGGEPGDWLARYSGARTVGLGSAYVAAADAAVGVLWNPATIGLLDRNELMFETSRLFEDTSVYGLSLAVPGRRIPGLGFSVIALRSGEFEKTNELNESMGTFENGETAFLFTASKHVGTRFALGTNLKVVQQSLEESSASGFGMDLGGLVNVTPSLRLGVSFLNVGGPSLRLRETDEKYPVDMRGGFALRLFGGRGLLSAELGQRGESPVRMHAGAEYWIQNSLALRVGFDASRSGVA